MGKGGTFFGLLSATAGVWLVDSAVQNRPPIDTLKSVIKDPKNALSTISTAKGTAYALPVASASSGTPAVYATGSGAAGAAITFARQQIGKPYKYGATGPAAYDCSGLVQAAYKAAGVSLPRTTAGMILIGTPVAKANLAPGDLVFPDLGHVQIYTGNGTVVEAPSAGKKVREVPMWGFFTARRIPTASAPPTTVSA